MVGDSGRPALLLQLQRRKKLDVSVFQGRGTPMHFLSLSFRFLKHFETLPSVSFLNLLSCRKQNAM
jgi:hypothetical protein